MSGAVRLIMPTAVGAALVLLAQPAALAVDPALDNLDHRDWAHDLEWLADEMRRSHPDLYRKIDRKRFDRRAAELAESMPERDTLQSVGALFELAALPKDDSTYIYPFQDALDFQLYPLLIYWFEDGLRTMGATGQYRALVGTKLTAIGGIPIDEAYSRVGSTLSGENDQARRYAFLRNGMIPELLYATGLSESAAHARFTFEDDGGEVRVITVRAETVDAWKGFAARSLRLDAPERGFQRHSGRTLWSEYLEDEQVLFVRVNQVRDNPEGPGIADVAADITTMLGERDVHRVVLDARYGGGGSGHSMGPLVELFSGTPDINRHGGLYVLTGHTTRGTVLELVSMLRNTTRAVYIGQPTSEGPNGVGDPALVTLPKSGIEVAITEIFWPTAFEDDPRTALSPDIPVAYVYGDYTSGRDPALEAALSHVPVKAERDAFPPEDLGDLPGWYKTGSGEWVRIKREGEQLYLTLHDPMEKAGRSFFRVRQQLYPAAAGQAATGIPGVRLAYAEGGIELEWHGARIPLTRVPVGALTGAVALLAGMVTVYAVRRRARRSSM